MIEAVLVTILPAGFLIVLFGGGALFKKRKIEQDGQAPINRTLFYVSKYSILVLWGAMVLQSWGITISFIDIPRTIQLIALLFWVCGFAFLYLGRLTMRDSFRLGTPKEETRLRTDGLFRMSRNPMYVGFDLTTLSSVIFHANLIVLAMGLFSVVVYHLIILGEEKYLRAEFGEDYRQYAARVRRYL